jgi:hypothetical protein
VGSCGHLGSPAQVRENRLAWVARALCTPRTLASSAGRGLGQGGAPRRHGHPLIRRAAQWACQGRLQPRWGGALTGRVRGAGLGATATGHTRDTEGESHALHGGTERGEGCQWGDGRGVGVDGCVWGAGVQRPGRLQRHKHAAQGRQRPRNLWQLWRRTHRRLLQRGAHLAVKRDALASKATSSSAAPALTSRTSTRRRLQALHNVKEPGKGPTTVGVAAAVPVRVQGERRGRCGPRVRDTAEVQQSRRSSSWGLHQTASQLSHGATSSSDRVVWVAAWKLGGQRHRGGFNEKAGAAMRLGAGQAHLYSPFRQCLWVRGTVPEAAPAPSPPPSRYASRTSTG